MAYQALPVATAPIAYSQNVYTQPYAAAPMSPYGSGYAPSPQYMGPAVVVVQEGQIPPPVVVARPQGFCECLCKSLCCLLCCCCWLLTNGQHHRHHGHHHHHHHHGHDYA